MPESFISSATCISFSFLAMMWKIFLGPLRYIALIALAAFVGDILHIASAPASTIPCIGASGGIAGLITFYALAFPQAKIGFLWRYFYYFRWLRLPAWFVFVLWILFQIIGAYEQKIGISSVSSLRIWGSGCRRDRVVSYPKKRASRSSVGHRAPALCSAALVDRAVSCSMLKL